jgi:hypothetical protein
LILTGEGLGLQLLLLEVLGWLRSEHVYNNLSPLVLLYGIISPTNVKIEDYSKFGGKGCFESRQIYACFGSDVLQSVLEGELTTCK